MGLKRSFALVTAGLMLTGCVNSTVTEWALIGAASGAATGAGVGVLISDPDLAGSTATDATGDVSIESDAGILGGVLIGAVFGAIVGSMVGHHRHNPDQDAYEEQLEANTTEDGSAVELSAEDLGVDLGVDEDDLEGEDDSSADDSSADDEDTL